MIKKTKNNENVVSLIERKPNYTPPLLYALAAVDSLIEKDKEAPLKQDNITDDEKINVASQVAGISKEEALIFCQIMKQLY